jgi:glutamate---cysteine ligase / carboxylate-amine ligase
VTPMGSGLPDWAVWGSDPTRPAWTVGIEEEVMLVEPGTWALAHRIDDLLPELSPALAASVSAETHACTLELASDVHASVRNAVHELLELRKALADELGRLDLRAAVAGTHPFARGEDTEVSGGARYQVLHDGLRELARREPTFALHVHVGVPDSQLAIAAADRLRAHLPLVLALSANSPYWRGRDSGMASVRTPLFQAFPRAGIPRRFGSYESYAEAVDVMLRADAFPEPTFIWWDVRLQPRFGTIEVRIADAQTRVAEVAGLAALIQSLVRLEATEGWVSEELVAAQEVIEENRFLAARDGIEARLINVRIDERVPAREQLELLLAACAPHAEALGCAAELEEARALAAAPGARRQREAVRQVGQRQLVAALAGAFLDPGPAGTAALAAAGGGEA